MLLALIEVGAACKAEQVRTAIDPALPQVLPGILLPPHGFAELHGQATPAEDVARRAMGPEWKQGAVREESCPSVLTVPLRH